jgi:hypothetical protein
MKHRNAEIPCSTKIHGLAALTCTDMDKKKIYAAWKCSMDMKQSHITWT